MIDFPVSTFNRKYMYWRVRSVAIPGKG